MKRSKPAPAAKPKPDYRALWEARKGAWVLDTWLYFMRDLSYVPCYLYVRPTSGSAWGELITVREDAQAPAGCELACTERIPPGDKVTIARWLERFAGRLPVIPADL
jgi:hypothetical protein